MRPPIRHSPANSRPLWKVMGLATGYVASDPLWRRPFGAHVDATFGDLGGVQILGTLKNHMKTLGIAGYR